MDKQIFHHYEKWEDVKAGMYRDYKEKELEYLTHKAVELLTDCYNFEIVCLKVLEKWKYSTECNLTNPNVNKKAWLGQSACCYAHNIPEDVTRIAWSMLTEEEKQEANKVASKTIKNWVNKRVEKNAKKLF